MDRSSWAPVDSPRDDRGGRTATAAGRPARSRARARRTRTRARGTAARCRTKRSSASMPSANSRSASERLRAEAALAQPLEVGRVGVLGAVDDPQVLAAAALDRRLHQAACGPRATKSSGLTTIPSPPRAVSSSHQRRRPRLLSASVDVDDAGPASRAAAGRPAARRSPGRPCARRGRGRRGRAPRRRAPWNGARRSRRARRPASSSAGTPRRSARPSAGRARWRSSSSATSTPARGGRSQRRDGRGEAGAAAAPTAAYWLRMSSCALADHGISSASRQQPVGGELVPQPGARRPPRARGRGARPRSSRRRRTAGRCACRSHPVSPSSTPNRVARDVRVAAHDDDRPRAHVLLLADDLRRRRSCGSRRTPRPGARAGPAPAGRRDGAIVGGR